MVTPSPVYDQYEDYRKSRFKQQQNFVSSPTNFLHETISIDLWSIAGLAS